MKHIGQLLIEKVEDFVISASTNIIYVDKDKLEFPLEFRLWNTEDTFQLAGMNGKKKVSKYLKDEKLSLVEKENIWVLTSRDKIIWVVGKRADHRFGLADSTKNILKIEIK